MFLGKDAPDHTIETSGGEIKWRDTTISLSVTGSRSHLAEGDAKEATKASS